MGPPPGGGGRRGGGGGWLREGGSQDVQFAARHIVANSVVILDELDHCVVVSYEPSASRVYCSECAIVFISLSRQLSIVRVPAVWQSGRIGEEGNGGGCGDAGVPEDSSRGSHGDFGQALVDRRRARSSTAAASGGDMIRKGVPVDA